MAGAFQRSAFQNSAFQVDAVVSGEAVASLPSLSGSAQGHFGEEVQPRRGGGLARPWLPDEYYFRKPQPTTTVEITEPVEIVEEPRVVVGVMGSEMHFGSGYTEQEIEELAALVDILDVAA